MASLRTEFGDKVTYRYHEFNAPDSAQVVRDFQIRMHPEIFILDPRGHLVRKFEGVAPLETLRSVLRPLAPDAQPLPPQPAVEARPAPTQRDGGEGGVEVEVTYVAPDSAESGESDARRFEPERYTVFLVSMNTHSVDLSGYDVLKMGTLRAGGRTLVPLRWVSTADDSHHRAGALIFQRIATTQAIELVLRSLAGVPVRTFRWVP